MSQFFREDDNDDNNNNHKAIAIPQVLGRNSWTKTYTKKTKIFLAVNVYQYLFYCFLVTFEVDKACVYIYQQLTLVSHTLHHTILGF